MLGLCVSCLLPGLGCGGVLGEAPAPLFLVPLEIEGHKTGGAIIDTGGGYEVLLRNNFGLEVIDTVEVLAFGGRASVDLTEGFAYSAGGLPRTAPTAIVSDSICDCNGLGFFFFRETGVVLGLDFVNARAVFLSTAPAGGVTIPFEAPPAHLYGFDTAFVEVEVASGGAMTEVVGLLDTGANITLMRRGLVGAAPALDPNRQSVTISHDRLGTVAVGVVLFETEGLPDVILGTDVMRVWADEWYFCYSPAGGSVVAFRPGDAVEAPQQQPRFLNLIRRPMSTGSTNGESRITNYETVTGKRGPFCNS